MFPRSGGEKIYLEAVYKKPKYLATIIFAANAILLGFTSANCIVCVPIPWFDIYLFLFIHPCYRFSRISKVSLIIVFKPRFTVICCFSILIAAGHAPDRWVVRGISLGGRVSFFLM